MVITVHCPSCSTSFPVDPAKVPPGGVHARCSRCNSVFFVEEPDTARPDTAIEERPAMAPERAESGPPASDWTFADDETTADAEEAAFGFDTTEAGEALPASDEGPGEEAWDSPPISSEMPEFDVASSFDEPDEEAVDDDSSWADAIVEGTLPEPVGEAAEPPVFEAAEPAAPPAPPEPEPEPPPEPARAADQPSVLDRHPRVEEPEPPVAAEPTPRPAPTPEPQPAFTFGKRDPHDKAKRLARVLVHDMIMYNPERHSRAIESGSLREDFEDEIKKSWKEYVDQVGDEIAEGTSYFDDALNEILAKGERVFP